MAPVFTARLKENYLHRIHVASMAIIRSLSLQFNAIFHVAQQYILTLIVKVHHISLTS